MTKMSKTAALKSASKAVSGVIRTGSCSYVIYGPYRLDDISGPSTEQQDYSYPRAQNRRAKWVAEIALVLMGHKPEDFDLYEIAGSAKDRVEHAIRAIGDAA